METQSNALSNPCSSMPLSPLGLRQRHQTGIKPPTQKFDAEVYARCQLAVHRAARCGPAGYVASVDVKDAPRRTLLLLGKMFQFGTVSSS